MTPVQRFNRHTPPPLILVTSFQVWAGQGSVCTPPQSPGSPSKRQALAPLLAPSRCVKRFQKEAT